ncbi:hypothetical protein AMD27_12890 [Acinetobacter sp. TGL-Y2]|uniref:hypothetical protein n=1 Tax=Acinetobacter sp. TGL-Y2 TaxID=1407071 RepID=UPI0007A67899|nr:hypothetical protein [Acinetobacter sp. TGL-Y2]AMW79698.1 hypothetical protein AMD27_12890 [Acinetobacter sp. TGL-Y2]
MLEMDIRAQNMDIKIRQLLDPKYQFYLYKVDTYFYISYQFDSGFMGGERIHGISKEDFRTLLSNPLKFTDVIYYKYMVGRDKFPVDFPELKNYPKLTRETDPFILYQLDNHYFLLMWKGRIEGQQIAKEISQRNFDKLMRNEISPIQI